MSAEQGYSAAQFGMGTAYFYGMGIQRDLNEAARWYRKAADQGYPNALYNLGVLQMMGYDGR